MARKRKGQKIDGWINLNKPKGIGSTNALGKVKYALKPQKAGHAGTLDPLADGVLPIALGEATKTIPYCQDALKTYEFEVTWGIQTSTDDAEGEHIKMSDDRPSKESIEALLPSFIGDIEQTPPQFSAVKINGERAYDIARDGDIADIKPRSVYIKSLTLCHPEQSEGSCEAEEDPSVVSLSQGDRMNKTRFECLCGKGTYIRSLARDMGEKLGCFGYISALTRTAVGPFALKDAISLDSFEEMGDNPDLLSVVLPIETVLDDIPALALKEKEAQRLRCGNPLSFIARPDMDRIKEIGIAPNESQTALATYEDRPIALVEIDGPDIKALRVLNL